jgi:hypothetical protein
MGGAEYPGAEVAHLGHAQARPIERSHRHIIPAHSSVQGFYHPQPQGHGTHQQSHAPQQQHHRSPAHAEYQRTRENERHAGEGRIHPPPAGGQYGDEWEDEEDEEEVDELEDEEGEGEEK